jgi:hypothetical protein
VLFDYDPRKDKKALDYQTFNIGISNKNFMATASNETNKTDYKQRKYKNFQVCDLEDPSIKDMLGFIQKKLLKDYHKVFSAKYGWMDKKEYYYVAKRIRNLMKDGALDNNFE